MSKVVFINRFFYPDHSATSQLLTDLAFYIASEGWQVHVLCARQHYEKSNEPLKKYEIVNQVHIHRLSSSNFGRVWLPGKLLDYLSFFITMLLKLFLLLNRDDVLVVKTDPPLMSVLTIIVSKLKRAKQVNWAQDLFPEVLLALSNNKLLQILGKPLVVLRNWSFKQSVASVVIGQVMKQKLLAQGIAESTIHVIPNWSDEENIKPVERYDNPLRSAWGLEDKFVVGYSGNLGRVHEFSTILSAIEKLKTYEDIVFVFIGGGPQKQYLESEAKKRQLTNIQFHPYQDYGNLSNSLSLPDIHLISLRPEIEGYCVPSKYYGVIAAGRPTIFVGDKAGEIALILQNEQTGYSVGSTEIDDLVSQILKLKENPEEISHLSQKARTSFEKLFNKTVRLHDWRKIIQMLCNVNNP